MKFQLGLSTGNYTTTITLPGSPPVGSALANTTLSASPMSVAFVPAGMAMVMVTVCTPAVALAYEPSSASALAFDPPGRRLASGDDAGVVIVREVATGRYSS